MNRADRATLFRADLILSEMMRNGTIMGGGNLFPVVRRINNWSRVLLKHASDLAVDDVEVGG